MIAKLMGRFSESCWRRRLAPTGHYGKTIAIPKLVGWQPTGH